MPETRTKYIAQSYPLDWVPAAREHEADLRDNALDELERWVTAHTSGDAQTMAKADEQLLERASRWVGAKYGRTLDDDL